MTTKTHAAHAQHAERASMRRSVYMAMVSLPPADTTTAEQLGVQLWLMRLAKVACAAASGCGGTAGEGADVTFLRCLEELRCHPEVW